MGDSNQVGLERVLQVMTLGIGHVGEKRVRERCQPGLCGVS